MTENPRRLNASLAPGALQTEHCDIPGEMTLGEWRRSCDAERRAQREAGSGGAMRRRLRRLFGS